MIRWWRSRRDEPGNPDASYPSRSCASCEWVELVVTEPYLQCRRFPPTVMFDFDGDDSEDGLTPIAATWPGVNDTDWCGEFTP